MNEQPTYSRHALGRLQARGITEENVVEVLTNPHTRYSDVDGNPIYVGTINGRRLKVVVSLGSSPPHIVTVIWLD